jgi:hypothetical protein
MGKRIEDGGPAFPQIESRVERDYDNAPSYAVPYSYGGMTLRDYFAAEAMAGGIREFFAAGDAWDDYDDLASSCYLMADAMLKARKAK